MMTLDASRLSVISFSMLAFAVVVSSYGISSAQDKAEVTCYNAVVWDADNDGYAAYPDGARGKITHKTPRTEMFSCPKDYVRYKGDCDDGDANVHPYRAEVPFNGVDDNCNERIDETTFAYSLEGQENDGGILVQAIINDSQIRGVDQLYYEASVDKLSDSSDWQKRRVARVTDRSGNRVRFRVSSLSPGTVYRLRVKFFKRNPDGSFKAVGRHRSDSYFTSTKGSSAYSNVRTEIVNRAIHEWDESNRGKTGYMGTVAEHGQRYGAKGGENWCSELYTWIAGRFVKGMDGITNVPGLTKFFSERGEYLGGDRMKHDARRGDYLPMATAGEDGKKNHSAMFLAYDDSNSNDPVVWTLEGNLSDQIKIRTREVEDGKLRGFGRIRQSMLK